MFVCTYVCTLPVGTFFLRLIHTYIQCSYVCMNLSIKSNKPKMLKGLFPSTTCIHTHCHTHAYIFTYSALIGHQERKCALSKLYSEQSTPLSACWFAACSLSPSFSLVPTHRQELLTQTHTLAHSTHTEVWRQPGWAMKHSKAETAIQFNSLCIRCWYSLCVCFQSSERRANLIFSALIPTKTHLLQ